MPEHDERACERAEIRKCRKTGEFVQKYHFYTSEKIEVWLKTGKRARTLLDHYNHGKSIVLWQVHTMWVLSSSPPLAPPQQDPHVNLSSYTFLNPLLPFGWIVSSCPHTKNTVQDSICLQVLSRYETQTAVNSQLSAPRFLALCQHHLLTTLKTIRSIKRRKRDIRKKRYFPGHFDGSDQVLFGIENFKTWH